MYLNSPVMFFFILFHEKTKTNNEFVTHQNTFGFLDFPLKNKMLDFSFKTENQARFFSFMDKCEWNEGDLSDSDSAWFLHVRRASGQ